MNEVGASKGIAIRECGGYDAALTESFLPRCRVCLLLRPELSRQGEVLPKYAAMENRCPSGATQLLRKTISSGPALVVEMKKAATARRKDEREGIMEARESE